MSSGTGRSVRLAMFVLVVAGGFATGACKRSGGSAVTTAAASGASEGEPAPAVPFEIRRDTADLTYFWFDARGNAHAVTQMSEIPEANRDNVRVDPARPEQRAPGWVYIADLRAPAADGHFTVRSVQSEQFANELAALNGLAAAMAAPSNDPTAPGGGHGGAPVPGILAPNEIGPPNGGPPAGAQQPRVVVYGASWCSACHQAAAWLRANNVPFIEHDIEREPEAAQQMQTRARAQGVSTGSIPIIDVGGRLMVGFSPDAIQQALRGS